MARDFWPCVDLYGDDGALQSVIFTEFQRLDRTYPKFATSARSHGKRVRRLQERYDW